MWHIDIKIHGCEVFSLIYFFATEDWSFVRSTFIGQNFGPYTLASGCITVQSRSKYRSPRLQWHYLQWHPAYSDTFCISQMIDSLLNYLWLQWQSVYSDTFSMSRGCHCKRGPLYNLFRRLWWDKWYNHSMSPERFRIIAKIDLAKEQKKGRSERRMDWMLRSLEMKRKGESGVTRSMVYIKNTHIRNNSSFLWNFTLRNAY